MAQLAMISNSIPGDPRVPLLVLYVPSFVLLSYGATLSDNGVYLVSRPIPFEQVRDAWIAVPQPNHAWRFREVRKILSDSLDNEIVENVNGTHDPNGAYLDATPAKVKEILLSLNPGPRASERDQLVAELDAGDRSFNLKRRCVAMCSRHYSNTYNSASQREPLKLRVCPQCMHETPTKLAICHHCLAIFDCVGRKEYIAPTATVVIDVPEVNVDTLQQAQAEADAEVEAAMDAEPTPEPGSADGSDRETSPEPDPEALEHDEEMMGEGDRQDANDVDYDESILDDELRGVLQLGHDSNINTLNARAMAALTVRLYPEDQGPYFVANYDSSHVAAQFMDVIFCGLIYDFWPSFARFYRLPYPDMLMRFKDGSRHDAMGNWPIVELDANIGLPRDLTDAEIIEHTRQPEMKEWRHRRYKMHKMLSIAVRGCIALDYRREHFNIKDHPRRTVRADMRVTFNRILTCVFGVKAYSYFRGNMPHVPGYMHIDPGAMLASQPVKETLTETLVLVRGHGYALPPDCDKKFTGYLLDKKRRPMAEMKILPIEYLAREPTDQQRADAIQQENCDTGVRQGQSYAMPSSARPSHHPGPYPAQRPKGSNKGERGRWDRASRML